MNFRDHPILICDGVKTWPPKWLHTYGPGVRSISGEIGMLEAVFLSQLGLHKVCLLISEGAQAYLGTLMFENPAAAKAVFEFLNSCVGKSVASVAAAEFPDALMPGREP